DPVQLRPLLAAFGAEHLIPAGTTEQWATTVDLAGSVAQLDTARLAGEGTAGSVLLLAARVYHVEQWPRTDSHAELSEVSLGAGGGASTARVPGGGSGRRRGRRRAGPHGRGERPGGRRRE